MQISYLSNKVLVLVVVVVVVVVRVQLSKTAPEFQANLKGECELL